MAAGLGFKTFATGDVLTAADTNGYLMQGVWVFANATARDAAVTSPQEGNTCYLKDTDVIQVYSGSAWVTKSGAASPLTTKGDLYTYSTTDTRLGVGTNGQFLTADSTAATGLAWSTVATGAYTEITSTTFNNTSGTWDVTSIPSTYTHLYIYAIGLASNDINARDFQIRFNNNSTGNNYSSVGTGSVANVFTGYGTAVANNNGIESGAVLAFNADTDTRLGTVEYFIPHYAKTDQVKSAYVRSKGVPNNESRVYYNIGTWNQTAAINQITAITGGGKNFRVGKIFLYGVK